MRRSDKIGHFSCEVDMKHEILAICTAYEQGYGHGYDQRNLGNPYKANSDEWQAWDYGYGEGLQSECVVCDDESSVSPICSTPLIEMLVDAAMEIAMFDYDWNDNSIPEVKYHRDLFTERFSAIIGKRR